MLFVSLLSLLSDNSTASIIHMPRPFSRSRSLHYFGSGFKIGDLYGMGQLCLCLGPFALEYKREASFLGRQNDRKAILPSTPPPSETCDSHQGVLAQRRKKLKQNSKM